MLSSGLVHLGTIHRKGEHFIDSLHIERYLREVLRLDISYENTELNRLSIYQYFNRKHPLQVY